MPRLILISSLLATALAAQQPPISNAKLQTAAASGGLESSLRAAIASVGGPMWIGYAVPTIPGERQSCCWNNDSRGCGLEGQRNVTTAAPSGPVQLEGPTHVAILFRVDEREVRKIRAFSIDCPLDAGGLPFVWVTGVRAADSVAYLVKNGEDSAVHAIAMHAGPEAETALSTFATSGATEKVRKSAIFWLAVSRGRPGFEVVRQVARKDTSDKVREHAIFALTQSKETEAVPTLVAIAKEDSSPHVRGQALFWLAQKASKQASTAITTAIEQDPNTEVKKKAVFALTQMPADEGVPMLIQVARANANPAVRKQAMFWLGQSRDPRAIKFFEEVLSK